jgi:endonuclease G
LSEISAAPGKKLYIVAGPRGGNGSIGRKEKIAVPAKTWKVIVVLNRQGLGIQGITPDTQGDHRDDAQLGQRQEQEMEKLCLVPVKQVERETGLNFLSNVSPRSASH